MSRPLRSRGDGRADNPVSLFPFLSVLICTMGTLILLLVVINRNARTQATEQAGIKPDEIIAELDIEAQTFEVFARDLQQSKERTGADVHTEQLRLATLESEIENMVAEIKRAEAAYRELENNRGANHSEGAKIRELLAARQEALKQAEAEVKTLQEKAAAGKSSYAIIPYRGANGTERRPIYIECRNDCVIIQPEGIVLREDDFLTASHPDNPLDTMLRAANLHYNERERTPQGTKPYPLIIVRPGGIDAYYAVRESIRSWGENFGYELVESDWNLEFPPPDEALKQRLETQLAASRERMMPYKAMLMQRYMAANRLSGDVIGNDMMGGGSPGTMAGNSRYDDRPSTGEITGMSGAGGTFGGTHDGTFGGTTPDGNGFHGTGQQTSGRRGNGQYGNGGDGTASDNFENVDWQEVMAAVGASSQSGSTQKPKVEYRVGPNGNMVRYVDGQPAGSGTGGSGTGTFANGSGNRTPPTNRPQGSGQGTPSQYGATTEPQYGANATTNATWNTTANQANSQEQHHDGAESASMQSTQSSQQSGYSAAGTSSASMANDGDQMSNTAMPSLNMTLGDKPESKNAMRMPRNWAMPNVGQGDTEMVRPISVECLPDKILIRRAGGAGINRDVDIPVAGLSTVGNTVISHMLDYMATWGNAARGTCWQPELIVTVQPGAERQFDELKSLMQNSGMKIRRK